jgi:hypothetical protein
MRIGLIPGLPGSMRIGLIGVTPGRGGAVGLNGSGGLIPGLTPGFVLRATLPTASALPRA